MKRHLGPALKATGVAAMPVSGFSILIALGPFLLKAPRSADAAVETQ